MNIHEFRAQHPEYDDLADDVLAEKLRAKMYPDMRPEEFRAKFVGGAAASSGGRSAAPVAQPPAPSRSEQKYGIADSSNPFKVLPQMAMEAGKDVAAYPRARIIDPIAQGVRGAGAALGGGRWGAGATPTPEENERKHRASALEIGLLSGDVGGPLEGLAAKAGAKPLLARILGQAGGGAVAGAADAGIRTGGDLRSTGYGGVLGGLLGGAVGAVTRGHVPTPAKEPDFMDRLLGMSKKEFDDGFTFHAAPGKTAEAIRKEGIKPGSWFSQRAHETPAFAKGDDSVVFGVPRKDIKRIPADAEDIFGQEYDAAGLYQRSGERHAPAFDIPAGMAKDPRRALVYRALQEGRQVPPAVLAEYPGLARFKGAGAPGEEITSRIRAADTEASLRAGGVEATIAPPVAEGVSPFVRMSGATGKDTGAAKRGLKTLALGYWNPSPLAAGKKLVSGESLNDAMTAARRGIQDAEERASVEMKRFFGPRLTGKGMLMPQQMDLIRQHATAESFLEDLKAGRKLPEGYTPEQLDKDYVGTAIELSKNPEAAQAYKDYRTLMNAKRAELVNRGYNIGYQKGYTPVHSLAEMENLLPPSQRAGRTPSFMKSRGKQANLRSSDVPHLMGEYTTQYNRKIAEDDLFSKLQSDPEFNLAATEEGRKSLKMTGIPAGYVRFEAQMGSPGFGKTRPGKIVQMQKATQTALMARRDLLQRAARETEEAASGALKRAETSRQQANLLESNAKAITRQREALAKNLEIAKARAGKYAARPELDQQYKQASRVATERQARLARLEEREQKLIARAQDAQAKVARSEAQAQETVRVMKKKATRLMAKAEKVGQRAERGKRLGRRRTVTMVIERDAAEALSKFYPATMSDAERVADVVGRGMAQSATTLNPANRMLNMPSDLWMATAGPAGERGTFTKGIAARRLARYPSALASMMKGAFGGESKAYDLAREAGAVSGTFQHEIQGTPVPHDLRQYYWPEKPSLMRTLMRGAKAPYEAARAFSTATEAAPRAAASQEAVRRGLPFAEQSRLSHEVSLPYGSGTSAWAKSKLSKVLARFSTYPGLADVRIAQGLTKEGSRSRYAALLTIPPVVAAQWNTQNKEYADYERGLKRWVKASLHVNYRDVKGEWSTYVVRADPFSETMNRWGVGQLPGRALKAAKGAEPLDLSHMGEDALAGYLNFYPLGPAVESIRGETQYHKKLKSPLDRIANMSPVIRLGKEAVETGQEKGAGAGIRQLLERTLGAGARPYRAAEVTEKKAKAASPWGKSGFEKPKKKEAK